MTPAGLWTCPVVVLAQIDALDVAVEDASMRAPTMAQVNANGRWHDAAGAAERFLASGRCTAHMAHDVLVRLERRAACAQGGAP